MQKFFKAAENLVRFSTELDQVKSIYDNKAWIRTLIECMLMLKIHVNVPLVFKDQVPYQRQETRSLNVAVSCRTRRGLWPYGQVTKWLSLHIVSKSRRTRIMTSEVLLEALVTVSPNFIRMDSKRPIFVYVFRRSFSAIILIYCTITSIFLRAQSNFSMP